jgi:hypothetical protein
LWDREDELESLTFIVYKNRTRSLTSIVNIKDRKGLSAIDVKDAIERLLTVDVKRLF